MIAKQMLTGVGFLQPSGYRYMVYNGLIKTTQSNLRHILLVSTYFATLKSKPRCIMRWSVLLCIVPVFLFSCKPEVADNPKATAKAFVDAMLINDFDEAGKYVTKESQPGIEMCKSTARAYKMFGKKGEFDMAKELGLNGKKIDFAEPVMDGTDRAIVKILADGKEEQSLILVRKDNTWKVAFDKATIMDTERDKMEEDQPLPPVNTSPDSMKTP